MTEPLPIIDPGAVDSARLALFLDFDGTLVEFADHPDLVLLSTATRRDLISVNAALNGALAIVTGRDIADVDRFLAPMQPAVAGVHGIKRRNANGIMQTSAFDAVSLMQLQDRLQTFVTGIAGLVLEVKSGAVALHYRTRPEMRAACIAAVEEATATTTGFHIMHGKMVVEAKSNVADKGRAIADFMKEAPFKGRLPLLAGDDVTDECGFRVVNAMNGISIKVGAGDTEARFRAADTAAFVQWLGALADSFSGNDNGE